MGIVSRFSLVVVVLTFKPSKLVCQITFALGVGPCLVGQLLFPRFRYLKEMATF